MQPTCRHKLLQRWPSGRFARCAPDDRCSRRAGTSCSSAGRQGALPGAPLMTDAADVQAQAAPALAVRVPCLVRPWRPLSSAWSSRRAAASHVPRNAGRQGALPGAPLAAGAADRAAAVHWTRAFPVTQLALSHQGALPCAPLVPEDRGMLNASGSLTQLDVHYFFFVLLIMH